jgi:hypothetical protein
MIFNYMKRKLIEKDFISPVRFLIQLAGVKLSVHGVCGDKLIWKLSDDKLTVRGAGNMVNYKYSNIPWYSHRSSIKNAVIEDGVTGIGDYAFYSCIDLKSVTIPASITSIGCRAFYYCKALETIIIPNSVMSIGDGAFSACIGLSSITVPNSVKYIGNDVFSYCTGLTEINVDCNNPNYLSENGVLFNKDKTTLIKYPAGKTGAYVIPDSVIYISDSAFSYCTALTSITMGKNVKYIHDKAFWGCKSLTKNVS